MLLRVQYFLSNCLLFFALLCLCIYPAKAELEPTFYEGKIKWLELEPGLESSHIIVKRQNVMLNSELQLLRIDPNRFELCPVLARDIGKQAETVENIALSKDAIFAINSNFFDPSGTPLGLIIRNGVRISKLHKKGGVMTGVFFIKDGVPQIVHRAYFKQTGVNLAVQAGPRLIAKRKPVKISSDNSRSRRSGIAITDKKKIIIFATIVRFPGTTLYELQQTLLEPSLEISDALNFDGGGSSQLFVKEFPGTLKKVEISGGEKIPAALVGNRKDYIGGNQVSKK